MAYIKNKKELARITEGGVILGEITEKLIKMVKPGVSSLAIDLEAERLIREAGGLPAFKGYKVPGHTPFPATICASFNDEVVHGIPTKERIIKDTDLFSIDIGMQWPAKSGEGKKGDGYFTDCAYTVALGKAPQKAQDLVMHTQEALEKAIEVCVVGNSIADIGRAIETYVDQFGYGIVEDLVGHGVGHGVHEEPHIPNYYSKELESWKLIPGVVIAIEPMITLGSYKVRTGKDGWAVVTADGSVSSHSEHTIIITQKGPFVATRRPSEK